MKTQHSDHEQIARAALASMPACVYVYDLIDEHSVFQNRPFGQLLGYTPEESEKFKDGEWRRLIHPDDAARFPAHRERMKAMREGESVLFEYRMRHADGSWRWILSRDTPLTLGPSGATRLIVGAATDITERKRAEVYSHEVQDRQRFLIRLDDRLRELSHPEDVMSTAAELLGTHLAAGGAMYGQVDDGVRYINVERDWTDGHQPSVVGRHYLAAYGPDVINELRAGRTLRIDDTRTDPRVVAAEIAKAYEAVSVRAAVVVPLIKEGTFAAALIVTSGVPRRWSDGEVGLVGDVGERTWSAVERARAEQALRDKNAELQAVLDAVPAAIWIARDSEAREIVGNRASYDLLRLRAGENVSQTATAEADRPTNFCVLDASGQEIAPENLPVQRAARGEEVRAFAERVVFGDGTFVDLVGDAVPLRDDAGAPAGAVAVFVDVTASRRISDALRLSEERFQLAVEGAGAGVWDHDLVSRSFMWSARHFEMLGYAENSFDPTFEKWLERVHPDDRESATAEFTRGKASRTSFRALYRITRADTGEERWIEDSGRYFYDAAGQAVRCAGVIIDATERVRATQALRESEERFRNMADNAPVMVWTSDQTGGVTYLSRSWHEFTGQTVSEALGFGWLAPVHDEEREKITREDLEGNASRAPFQMEYRLRRSDGEYRWVLDVAAPRIAQDGTFLGFIGSVVDITERKQFEDHIRLLMGEINHRSKNLLAVVQAISHQSAKTGESAKEFERRFSARLRALAASQDLLTKRMWTGVPLDDLIRSQVDSELDRSRVFIESDTNLILSPSAAQTIGMALHELSVNAIKHGALSNATGRISIEGRIERDATGAPALQLTWHEKGGPAVRPPARKGFGHVVLDQALKAQLRARVDLDYAPEGLSWSVRVPLANIVSDADSPFRLPRAAPTGQHAAARGA